MKKRNFVLSFLIVGSFLFCFSSNVVSAKKIISYDITSEYETKETYFSKNYVCDLGNLENVFVSLANKRSFGDVLNIYNKCIEAYPNESYLYTGRGNVFKMLKSNDKALLDYDKSIALDPEYIPPYIGIATIYIIDSKYDAAIDFLDKLLQKKPKTVQAYYYKGLSYYFKNNINESLKNLNLAIKYGKNSAFIAYLYRGDIYQKNKEYKKAVSDYSKYINLALKNNNTIDLDSLGDVFFNRALTYYKLGNNKKMVEDLKNAYEYYQKDNDKDGMDKVQEILTLFMTDI